MGHQKPKRSPRRCARELRAALDASTCRKCGAELLTVSTFAKKIGVSYSAVTNWIYDIEDPSAENIAKIRDVLGIVWVPMVRRRARRVS